VERANLEWLKEMVNKPRRRVVPRLACLRCRTVDGEVVPVQFEAGLRTLCQAFLGEGGRPFPLAFVRDFEGLDTGAHLAWLEFELRALAQPPPETPLVLPLKRRGAMQRSTPCYTGRVLVRQVEHVACHHPGLLRGFAAVTMLPGVLCPPEHARVLEEAAKIVSDFNDRHLGPDPYSLL